MPPKKENSNNNNSIASVNGLQNSSNTASAAATTTTTTTVTSSSSSSSTTAAAAASSPANSSTAEQAAEQRQQLFLANAKLCRLVRKCPWMYDRNHPNYAKKQILDKSWLKIANDCDDSMASCKERWRNIRAAFARSINIYKTHGGPNRVKPYYLHNELRFLVKPMLDGQKEKGNLTDIEVIAKEEEQTKYYENDDDDEDDDAEQEEEEKFETENDEDDANEEFENTTTLKLELRKQRDKHVIEANEEENSIQERERQDELTSDPEADFNFPEEFQAAELVPPQQQEQQHHQQHHPQISPQSHSYLGVGGGGEFSPDESIPKRFKLSHHSLATTVAANEGADARFLETLVPDMQMMNARQKVIFKRKIYQSLEEVFETSTDFPNCSSTFSPPTPIAASSAAALSVAQSVATLCDSDLLKLSEFMKSHLRRSPPATGSVATTAPLIAVTATSRLQNGGGPVSSTPTRVGIIPGTNTTITRTIPTRHQSVAQQPPPPPTTTTPQTRRAAAAAAALAANTLSPWDQLVPIAVKEEIEDVEVD